MTTIAVAPAVPAAVGVGAATQIGNMQSTKSIVVDGAMGGVLLIEARSGAGGWCQLATFLAAGQQTIGFVADEVRVRRQGTVSGTPTVDISAEEGIVRVASLAIPAGIGVGASTNVSTFGEVTTYFFGGTFASDVVFIETSPDNTDFAQLGQAMLASGCFTLKSPHNFVRVRRTAGAGTPTVDIASVSEMQSIGFGEVDGLQTAVPGFGTATIQVGSCRDSTNSAIITTAGILTATLASSGANGLDTGAEASNTWYAIHIIDGPGVPVASLFSLSATAPTLPAGYTVFRRLGWARNSGSSNFFISFSRGNRSREYFFNVAAASLAVLSAGAASGGFVAVDCSAFIPPTARRGQFFGEQTTLAGPDLQVSEFGFSSAAAGEVEIPGGVAAGSLPRMAFYMGVDASQRLQYQNSGAGGTSNITVISYIDEI